MDSDSPGDISRKVGGLTDSDQGYQGRMKGEEIKLLRPSGQFNYNK